MTGRTRWIGAACVAALLLASCGLGETREAKDISDVSATLTGTVRNTVTGPTDYWFEYGTTTAYGSSSATESVTVANTSHVYPVSETIAGLDEGTEYHYRLCAVDASDDGVCGGDRMFTTTEGHDSVTGEGIIFSIPQIGFYLAASTTARSAPDGSGVTGDVTASPGSYYFRIVDYGPVTCLRVEGNRAAIGFEVLPPGIGEEPLEIWRLVFIEDNGPTGDRLSFGSIEGPATTCPVPTDADFAPANVGGFPFGPELESGDFVVHDHPSAP